MDQGFIDILKTIIKEQGKEAVIDSAKCKSFLADYTKGEFKKESRFLLQALEAKLPRLIDKEQDIEICFKKSVRIIVEDYGMGEGIAVDLVDTLIHVLKGVPFPKRETASQENESKNKPNKEERKEAAVPKEQYYISLNGTNSGPFELEAMKEKIKKGELKRETSIWKEGMKEWAAASAVKELSSFLPPSAPPPPAPEVKTPQPKPVPQKPKIDEPLVIQTEQDISVKRNIDPNVSNLMGDGANNAKKEACCIYLTSEYTVSNYDQDKLSYPEGSYVPANTNLGFGNLKNTIAGIIHYHWDDYKSVEYSSDFLTFCKYHYEKGTLIAEIDNTAQPPLQSIEREGYCYTIKKIFFNNGDRVEAGQKIAVLKGFELFSSETIKAKKSGYIYYFIGEGGSVENVFAEIREK